MNDGNNGRPDVGFVKQTADALVQNIGTVLVGKEETIEDGIVALFCEGHLLAEDVPGVGKTVFAKALAASLGLTFKRIQFTPDLLPSDVIGVTVFQRDDSEFVFRPGPIFAHVVLADEINRGTPRTQSSLLECMEERQVTVDGELRKLDHPFLVIATQNPIEFEGTFPLPEAQLDRFFARISFGYPDESSEVEMLRRLQHRHPIETIEKKVDLETLIAVQEAVRHVHVEPHVREYIVELVRKTRSHADVDLGVSPRGTFAMFRAAQARAALDGRDYVLPDDVKRMARSVMGHRLLMSAQALMRGTEGVDVIDEILADTDLPLVSGESDPA